MLVNKVTTNSKLSFLEKSSMDEQIEKNADLINVRKPSKLLIEISVDEAGQVNFNETGTNINPVEKMGLLLMYQQLCLETLMIKK